MLRRSVKVFADARHGAPQASSDSRALQDEKQAMMHLLYHRQNNGKEEKQLKLMILHGMDQGIVDGEKYVL